jgi:ATP-dependent Lhr-like helicase
MGKTLAVWGGPLLDGLAERERSAGDAGEDPVPLRHLWITPLRALARDTVRSLREPVEALGLPWTVELRTGDTGSGVKKRQRTRPPTVLVTTPESLSLLLSYPETQRAFAHLESVVVDEWHELLGTKRGVQTELGLARLRRWRPELRTWGLSATLGNLEEALDVLLGGDASGTGGGGDEVGVGRGGGGGSAGPRGGPGVRVGRLVRGPERPPPEVETVIPDSLERFPWAGHVGLRTLPAVVEAVASASTTLLFTNTRSQAEIWFQALNDARPGWSGSLALHHGSLDRQERAAAEAGLADGSLRCVVCTSSLDLGVDFAPVEQVVQVGSPKGVGRLLQRAGRSGHVPGARSRVLCVPTHAFELAEFAAARRAMAGGRVEPREPVDRPLDVLAQHLVTVGLGGGFEPDDLLDEVRTTRAFRDLSGEEWSWCLDFVGRGGPALKAYPRYARVRPVEGRYTVPDRTVARRHRMGIGTITSDSAMEVRFLRGARLGTIEESFISRLRPGQHFLFAGRRVKLVRVRDMTAYVRLARGSARGQVPRWMGGRMPLSSELGEAVREVLHRGPAGDEPELEALAPLLEIQDRWSRVPAPGRLLVERTRTREGHHLFLYPFLGRFVHDGLAALWAWRLTRAEPRTIHVSANDYGIELLAADALELDDAAWAALLSPEGLGEAVLESVNAAELARRRFRDIARIAGLVFPGYPGRGKSARQIQASSGLIFDVFQRYDADNLLLEQSRREVLERELEIRRMVRGLEALAALPRDEVETPRLTPLAFPVWAERVQARVSSESWRTRVERMSVELTERWRAEGAGVS